MKRIGWLVLFALVAAVPLMAADGAEAVTAEDTKVMSGMSVLGNNEAPKSLVIVPWKTSQLGDGIGVTDALDRRALPVDRDVFMREVGFYELRRGPSDRDLPAAK